MRRLTILLLPLLLFRVDGGSERMHQFRENSNKIIQVDLKPVSSHIRRLELELQRVEDEINRGSRHLRYLQEKHNERDALQNQLQQASTAMEGQSAAYASLMEFPYEAANGHGRRYLEEYHDNIHEFNERYRQYSRYERALREEVGEQSNEKRILQQKEPYFLFSKSETSLKQRASSYHTYSTREIDTPSSLFETNWQATQISFSNNATEPPQYPITMSIDGEIVTGETGCNFYRASIHFYQNETLVVGSMATTRMACEPDRMEQEEHFTRLMEHVRFDWEIVAGELILSVDEFVVAQFIEIPFVREVDDSFTTTAASITNVEPSTTTDVTSTGMTLTIAASNYSGFALVGTSWQAVEIGYKHNGSIDLRPALQQHPVTLIFDDDGRIGGHAGCNSYGAEVLNMTDSTFTVGPLMITMMYCFGDGVMKQEEVYVSIFRDESVYYEVITDGIEAQFVLRELLRVDGYEVKGDVVAMFVLLHEDLRGLRYAQESTEVTDIIGTEWMATEYAYFDNTLSPAVIEMHPIIEDNPITIAFASATQIYGTIGCNDYFSIQAKVSANRLEIGGVAKTSMLCSEKGIIEQEEGYTALLTDGHFFYKVISGDDDEDKLVLGESKTYNGDEVEGQVLIRFVRSNSSADTMDLVQRELQSTEIKKKGGLFNAYQTTPVHQGYGTHFATLWVGSPPQRKSVIIDTGSHYTAFPCKGCINCGEDHHTDPYFDPDASSTFHALTCAECQSASCFKGKCIFSQSYTEGSSWHAFEAIDKVFLGGRNPEDAASPINNSFQTEFLFGCQVKESGLFVTQLADGIMGMSAHPSTLPKVMYDQEKLEHNMFSICFRRELHVSKRGIVAGMLTLGGIDNRADLTPMVYARNVAATGWFTVFVKNIYIREQGADGPHQKTQRVNADLFEMNSGKGVIVDSGTTDTYLHKSAAGPFNEVWQKVTGRKYSNQPVALSQSDLLMLPTVLIQLAAYDDEVDPARPEDVEMVAGLAGDIDPSSPHDVVLAIPATHYMEYSPSKRTYTPRLYFTESKGGVIGSNAMQRHNVLFDWENRRVGIAESTCEYEDGNEQTDDGSVEVDCRLGQSNLVTSCSETVDLTLCNKPGTSDLTLSGHEVWTRIVTAPGTMQGVSCEQVAAAANEESGGGGVEVQCDGKGICKEIRQCEITCANAHAAGDFGNLAPAGSTATCGGATWSACDYSCTQTRINTILMTDGKCYVEKALEFSRPCHIQACGRSDPCRVPFVVHAILKIRGANALHWNKRSEEVFADAFSATVNEEQKGAGLLFGAGDVQVIRASPWKASDDAFGDAVEVDEELGMQLVVETSIFNYNAVVAPGAVPDAEPTSRLAQVAANNFFRSKYAPVSSCTESDLHHLANTARDIHTALGQPNFVARVVERIKIDEATEQMQSNSPFFNTIQDIAFAQQSSVVTSWTIKTDIGMGNSRGLDFIGSYGPRGAPVLLLLLSSSVVIGYVVWSRRNKLSQGAPSSSTSASTRRRSNRKKHFSRFETANRQDDDDAESILSLLSDTSDFRSVASTVVTSDGLYRSNIVAQGDNVSVLSDLLTKGGNGP